MSRAALIGVFACTLVPTCRTFGDEFEAVRERIRAYVDEEGIPSVAVAAVRGSDIVWLEAFGWADVENRAAATPNTPYMLASTSKPITATAVMVAVEKNLLQLDANVNQYLGRSRFKSHLGDASKITLRDVLLHRSGIPNYSEAYFDAEKYRPPDLDGLIRRYGWTMIPHGEFHYSNLAFSSLAQTISRTTGQTFASFVQSEVFDPLEMDDSMVPEAGESPKAAAIRYGDKGRLRDFSTSTVPAAEIYSSASDLARFAILHLKRDLPTPKKILADRRIDEMQSCTIPIRFFNYSYGLGWSIARDAKDRRHVFHGGGFAGCDTLLTLIPEEQVAVVFLSNKNRRWPGIPVSQDIVERTLSVLVNDEIRTLRINYDRTAPQTDESEDVWGQWRGTVLVGRREEDVSLRIDSEGHAQATFGRREAVPIENPEVIANAFFGTSIGELKHPASRLPQQERINWDLRLVNERLQGVLYVNCASEGNGYLKSFARLAVCAILARNKLVPFLAGRLLECFANHI